MQQDHEDWRDFLASETYQVLLGHGRSGRATFRFCDGLVKLEVRGDNEVAASAINAAMRSLAELDLGQDVKRALAMSRVRSREIIACAEQLGRCPDGHGTLVEFCGFPVYIFEACGDAIYITTDPPSADIAFIHEMGCERVRRLAVIREK